MNLGKKEIRRFKKKTDGQFADGFFAACGLVVSLLLGLEGIHMDWGEEVDAHGVAGGRWVAVAASRSPKSITEIASSQNASMSPSTGAVTKS